MQRNSTIDTYNQYADTYDQEVIEFWDKFPKSFLDQVVQHAPGKKLLNVGSGSGRDAVLLRDLGFEVVCQDGSKSMVDMTKKLGFESHLADFSEIDFPASSFDVVWAYTSLIHIPKNEATKIIQKLRQLLKPNGTFAIGVIQGDSAGMVQRKTMPGSERYFKNYTHIELKKLIEPLGFAQLYQNEYQPHNSVYLNHLYKVTTE